MVKELISGKIYDCFDDGKVTVGRSYKVYIGRSVKFKDLPEEIRKVLLEKVIVKYPRLYAPSPEIVYETISYETKLPKFSYFLPTIDGGWFGCGEIKEDFTVDSDWCSGRLDVDGRLMKEALGE